jgi:hypothetical protein
MRLAPFALLAVALLAPSARAELVEVDLNAPGDALVTRDTETGLDWLDLGGVTTNLSYDAIQGGAGGWIASGWRYATQAEVCALFVDHTEATTCNYDSGVIVVSLPAAFDVIGLLQTTGSANSGLEFSTFLTGLYDDGNGGAAGEAEIEVLGTFPPSQLWLVRTGATADAIPASTASTSRGSFLVRATPPVIPALPWGGIAALVLLLAAAALRR